MDCEGHIGLYQEGTFQMKHSTGFYPRVRVDGAGKGVVSQAGGSLLTEAVRVSGLDRLLAAHTPKLLTLIPEGAWTPAYDAHDDIRDGAWVAELTDLLDLAATGWPPGMRVIVGKERPHPGPAAHHRC